MNWRKLYNQVLRSPRWRALKRARRALTGGKCERCGRADYLELHHKHYRNLGFETAEDVELLCTACHEEADAEREEEQELLREEREEQWELESWRRRFDGWLRKRGHDPEGCSQETRQAEWELFKSWLESKGEL